MAKPNKQSPATSASESSSTAGQAADAHGGASAATDAPPAQAGNEPAEVTQASAGRDGADGKKKQPRLVAVIGPDGGKRRAGMRFGPEPTLIDLNDFTEEQLQALQNDPDLRAVDPREAAEK